MLIVIAKSAVALALGGAVLGQQGNQSNPTPPPPAPSVQPTPAENQPRTNQSAAPRDNQQRIINNDQQTYQSPQAPAQGQQGRSALGVTLTDDLRIQQVMPGSPAEQMGLRQGDEILSMNGRTFNSVDAFIDAVGSTPQGQQVRVELDRNGQNLTQSGFLGPWDRIFYSGSQMAGMGPQGQGAQTYSAMRYPTDGSMNQGQPVDSQFDGSACCSPCAGYGDGYGSGGYGYGSGYAGGWGGGRLWRTAWGGGYYW